MLSDALKKAIKRYRTTERGQEVQRKAHTKYAASEKGQEALRRASEKFEAKNVDARREYKRLKAAEYRKKRQSGSESGSS